MNKLEACEILNISSTASTDEIRFAYKRLIKKHHPDNYRGHDAYVAADEHPESPRLNTKGGGIEQL